MFVPNSSSPTHTHTPPQPSKQQQQVSYVRDNGKERGLWGWTHTWTKWSLTSCKNVSKEKDMKESYWTWSIQFKGWGVNKDDYLKNSFAFCRLARVGCVEKQLENRATCLAIWSKSHPNQTSKERFCENFHPMVKLPLYLLSHFDLSSCNVYESSATSVSCKPQQSNKLGFFFFKKKDTLVYAL